ncbi:helix-turn-helix transcriptional regulator [Micromonospora sediminicola]|uniref:helix-turn-helix transcriptional regulator n=1 Tax=Micromonospora sediminicola TaxID=946078 RepID=UPI00378DECD5
MGGWFVGLEFVGNLDDMRHLNEVAEGASLANYNSTSKVLSLSGPLDSVEYDHAVEEAKDWASRLTGAAKLVREGVLAGPDRMYVETSAARSCGWALLGAGEVADRLRVSGARLRELEQRADFPRPVVEIAGGRGYRAEDIDRFGRDRGLLPPPGAATRTK